MDTDDVLTLMCVDFEPPVIRHMVDSRFNLVLMKDSGWLYIMNELTI